MNVYCEMKKGGWTRVMNRVNRNNFFNRNWQNYKIGFGLIEDNYWMGLDNMRKILGDLGMELRIDMYNNITQNQTQLYYFLVYDHFSIDSERKMYSLDLGNRINGNTHDSLRYSNLQKFTTLDRDNDVDSRNCANVFQGGWWFNSCFHMCLTCTDIAHHYTSYFDSMKMMIKPHH